MSPGAVARRIGRGTRKPENWLQLVKFGFVGASGYVVNLTVFAIGVEWLDIHYIPAAVGAFCVAVANNFLLNRRWTFAGSASSAGFQAPRFFAISVVALLINLAALEALISAASVSELPAQAIAVAIAMPANFIGNKLWTFA